MCVLAFLQQPQYYQLICIHENVCAYIRAYVSVAVNIFNTSVNEGQKNRKTSVHWNALFLLKQLFLEDQKLFCYWIVKRDIFPIFIFIYVKPLRKITNKINKIFGRFNLYPISKNKVRIRKLFRS